MDLAERTVDVIEWKAKQFHEMEEHVGQQHLITKTYEMKMVKIIASLPHIET